MKFKVVPEPPASIEEFDEIRAAVPLVPDDESSCRERLVVRTNVDAQDRAREWLTFLRALELVEKTDDGYRRLGDEPDLGERQRAFRERVILAEEVLDAVESVDEPRSVSAVFETVVDQLPHWERLRHDDPEATWRDRVERILEWAVRFEILDRVDSAYVEADTETR